MSLIDGSTGQALTAETHMAHAGMRVPQNRKLTWDSPGTEG